MVLIRDDIGAQVANRGHGLQLWPYQLHLTLLQQRGVVGAGGCAPSGLFRRCIGDVLHDFGNSTAIRVEL